ncbi:MAG: hypothetical protein HYZ13_03580 [Acidobacteria bacterium]|nr:hypothetical protein [Acidobacteriota bacterium]
MRTQILALLVAAQAFLAAQNVSKLPDWAAQAAVLPADAMAPADADAWVLLDRTEIAYTGSGEIRQRRFRLVKVLTERGTGQGVFVLHGLGGKASKVKKVKGWNLRPDNELVKLDSDNVVTMNDVSDAEFSTATLTGAVLERVVKGSYVAFESLESVQSPLGPIADVSPMESVPVRRWELEVAKKEGWFTNLQSVDVKLDRRHFEPWITKTEALGAFGFRVTDVPALPRDEGGHPHLFNVLPVVMVRFLDPALPIGRMWGSWDEMARWNLDHFVPAMTPPGMADLQGRKGLEGLKALWAWMGRSLTYKQVYLTPERGWVPEQPLEVGRKRYGDCKDLSAFFMAEAKGLGYSSVPALARIVAGEIEPQQEPFPVFNHVISAVRLESSLGLAAEVETPKGRFLLVDPTDPLTPLGHLGSGHRGRKLMICLPEGAVWVTVPDKAILMDRLQVRLEGEVQGSQLKATLKLQETGSYWGLRAIAQQGGTKGVRDSIMARRLDLPATAQVEVARLGDPLDLTKAFEVDLKVTHPEGFRRNGGEFELASWCIPGPFSLIQKAGVARRYPVSMDGFGELSYHAVLKVPSKVSPLLPERSAESPFRAFTWKAVSRPGEAGTILELDLDHRFKSARFDFDQRDKGLQEWKKDRTLVKSLLEDGLAFKPAP